MSETEQIYHIPVLLDESVSGMNIQHHRPTDEHKGYLPNAMYHFLRY